MATKHGMCKNCGSLIVFDDRNENCECVFCHCIFPGEEAIKILENPDDYTFANEEIEESKESTHYYVTKVNPDMVESAVARDQLMKSRENGSSIKPSDFEISPNDVKAPVKLTAIIIGSVALVILLVVAISLPLFKSRKALKADINSNIATVFDGVCEVDTSSDELGHTKGYTIFGQTCQNIKIALSTPVTEDECKQLFNKYVELRASKAGITEGKADGVTMEVFVSNGIYTVTSANGQVGVEFTEDVVNESEK